MIIFLKFILGFFAFYLLLIALLYFKQNSLVYFPPKVSAIDMAPLKLFTKQDVQTADGLTISGYFYPPQHQKPIILVFHGNASHPAWEASKFTDLLKQGYGLFLAEYRGYDGNPGVPDEHGVYKDGEAYYSWIATHSDYKNNSIIIHGASLGSGVAVDVASNHPEIKALILEVTFSKMSEVGAYHYPYIPFAQILMKNKFSNDAKIGAVKAPVLLLLAGKDEVVPLKFGKALVQSIRAPVSVHVFEEANHTNVYDFGAAKVVDEFLEKYTND